MVEEREEIIVGVLGQWACGKSTAVKTLIDYLGGPEEVVFIDDRALLAGRTIKYIVDSEEEDIQVVINEDGSRRYEGKYATVHLKPGDELQSVDLVSVLFDLHEIEDDQGLPTWCRWFYDVRDEMGRQICERSAEGKPIVVEAGFGTNTDPQGSNPFCHTINDLFVRLTDNGVDPGQIKWIIIEASYETRSERNRKRPDTVPADEFDRYAADGGDLEPEEQIRWESMGSVIKRVANEHGDIERYKADIIAAFGELFEDRRDGRIMGYRMRTG